MLGMVMGYREDWVGEMECKAMTIVLAGVGWNREKLGRVGVERLIRQLGDICGAQPGEDWNWEIRSGYGKIFSWKITCRFI